MSARYLKFFAAALLAASAHAQPSVRTFHFTEANTDQDFQELITVLRQVANVVPAQPVDSASRILTVSGTDAQLAMAGWLAAQLDGSAKGTQLQYRGATGAAAEIFLLPSGTNPQSVQEMVTTLREVALISNMFSYRWSAIALAGTSDQVRMAEWLMNKLEHPARESQSFAAAGSNGESVRVCYLKHERAPKEWQTIMHEIKNAALVRHAFLYQPSRAVALRGTEEQLATAERVIAQYDTPSSRP